MDRRREKHAYGDKTVSRSFKDCEDNQGDTRFIILTGKDIFQIGRPMKKEIAVSTSPY